MVGLVFVSHSRALADALVGLVSQVTATNIPIAVAAGADGFGQPGVIRLS